MLNAEEARLQANKSSAVVFKRAQLALDRDDDPLPENFYGRRRDAMRICGFEPLELARKPKPREFVALVGEFRDRSLARGVAPR
jgi:hypothetical protein